MMDCFVFVFVFVSVFLDKFATLDTMHALCLPLGASISLLVMFFFFDSMQMLFAVCTASKCHFLLLIIYILIEGHSSVFAL